MLLRQIKINTDESSVDHEWGNYGSLASDDQGGRLEGFVTAQDTLCLSQRSYREFGRGEIDSKTATDLMEEPNINNHPDVILIEDYRKLIEKMEATLIHMLRVLQKRELIKGSKK